MRNPPVCVTYFRKPAYIKTDVFALENICTSFIRQSELILASNLNFGYEIVEQEPQTCVYSHLDHLQPQMSVSLARLGGVRLLV